MKTLFFIFIAILIIINHFSAKYLEKTFSNTASGLYNEVMAILFFLEVLCMGFIVVFFRTYDK
jgi:hypothetical protein